MGNISLAFFLCLVLISGCSTLPKHPDRPISYALDPLPNTRIEKALNERLKKNHGPDESAFSPLITGQAGLLARLASTAAADHSLDLQYYIWQNDLTGHLMMYYVLKAADRGVRVRILLDDLNQGQYEKNLAVLNTHPNIKIRLVNPFANRGARWLDLGRFSQVDHRMHNKVFIADNEVAVVGGRNIGNEYFWASEEINFGDFDLWVAGPTVQALSKEFDTYWNSDIAYPIDSITKNYHPTTEEFEALRKTTEDAYYQAQSTEYEDTLRDVIHQHFFLKERAAIYWAKADVMYDPPEKLHQSTDKKVKTLRIQLRPLINETKKELILISPYFVPRTPGEQSLMALQMRGVQVTVLTNSLASSDQTTVFGGYKGSRKSLLKAGVHLYELKPKLSTLPKNKRIGASSSAQSGLHGKVFVFDRTNIFVGSMNLDPRSMELNSEMGVVVHSPAFASDFADHFFNNLPKTSYKLTLDKNNDLHWETVEQGQLIDYTNEPDTSFWKRFKAEFLSIFVPIDEL